MEIKIGIVNTARELVIDVSRSADDVEASLREAIANDTL